MKSTSLSRPDGTCAAEFSRSPLAPKAAGLLPLRPTGNARGADARKHNMMLLVFAWVARTCV